MKPDVTREAGFTLVELMVTVALVSLMASIAIPCGELLVRRAREDATRIHLRELRTAIDAYKRASDGGHIALAPGESGYPRRLADLLGVPDQKDPSGAMIRFMRKLPRNPLYPDPDAPAATTWGIRSYASSHLQPRPGRDIYDVYPLVDGKGINGVAYREW